MNSQKLEQAMDYYHELLLYQPIEILPLTEGAIWDKIKEWGNHVKDRMKLATKTFKKYGVNLAEIAKKGAAKFKNKMWDLFKRGIAPANAGHKLVKDMVKFVVSFLKPMAMKFKNMGKTPKIILSLLAAAGVVALVVIFNTSAMALFTRVGLSKLDALLLASVAVAPIMEEAMKTFFIKMNLPWIGTALFVGAENIIQGLMFAKNMGGWPIFLLLRSATNIFHFLTVKLQLDIEKESKEKRPDESELKRAFKMWSTAAVVHALVNGIIMFKSWDMYRGIFDKTSLQWWVNAFTGKPVAL